MKPLRIVTLAQLDLLPYGTIVSPIKVEDGAMQFDVQGTLQLKPKAVLRGRQDIWLVLVDELPDVRIDEGRITSNESVTHYAIPNDFHPHRFVVWEVPS
ncbi:hypothetical protein HOV23_gp108 [Pseudomonas phage Lana]|uniref:Uncharacterized protein n=1 Tax=Pseudomonas phage Lana TaxID=2530172 RepID=A0A481W672_9CAUD|nr:hypothetical protein HOV23_gp108 [Pseudomonas phage Lana]QBJ04465.1 hypothetical protein [Pseudomonas phage Lana]